MSEMFSRHRALLDGALTALKDRGFWSPFPEVPSGKIYGETARADGEAAFAALQGKPFDLPGHPESARVGTEVSPFGPDLAITYPAANPAALTAAAAAAAPALAAAGAEARVGACLEILTRLNKISFLLGYATQHTTGQAFAMAFQAGGPHAQDRGLEAVAMSWDEMTRFPTSARWEKPQGKAAPIVLEKHWSLVPAGVALTIGCNTFPTWNSYPGLFASLATGNPVIVKPHENAILPAAISVAIAREVLAEQGLDPNLVTLAVVDDPATTRHLATHRAVKSIDFTGSTAFGNWLLDHARQAQVYAELAGVNNVVIESTDNYKGMLKNLAFTLSLYAGQMCTTTQAIIVPAGGIDTDQGRKRFDEVAADLGAAVARFLSDESVATAVLGAIQSPATLARIEEAHGFGQVVLASKALTHAEFPQAQVRTPVIIACDAADEAAYMEERFGPISFVVRAADTDAALALSERIVRERGALTVGLYSTRSAVIEAMTEATLRAGVALSLNLAGGVFVNQSAAFSDYHGVGMNPAANASYADAAFVANRFRVVQRRYHID